MNQTDVIVRYVIGEFLPATDPTQLDADYDLLVTGVIDSLGLLKLIAWIEDRFSVEIGDEDLDPENFRSVATIDAFVSLATARRDAAPAGN